MPLYEYTCNDCKKDFELIHVSEPRYKIVCIYCNSENIKKKISKTTFTIKGYQTPKFHK